MRQRPSRTNVGHSRSRFDERVSRESPGMPRLLEGRERRAVSPAGRGIGLPPRFGCEVIPERDRVRIAPAGELDLATAPELERTAGELWAAGFTHVVLDLREVCFLDVAGLRMILKLDAAARADGSTFELIPGPPQVQRVLDLTGAQERLRLRASSPSLGTGVGVDGCRPVVSVPGWPR
jgi:anti-anti-sigma factor